MIQGNVAHAFLDYYLEADDGAFQILHRQGHGELVGMHLASSLVGSMGSAQAHGKGGLLAEVL